MAKTAEVGNGIQVAVEDARTGSEAQLWRPDDEQMQAWISAALLDRDVKIAEVSIAIVDMSESRALNRRYRQVDKATNVLSFSVGNLPIQANFLGDVVICAEIVVAEASEQGKTAQAHWLHMLIHGVLHLLGYDHTSEADAEKMEAIEIRLLGKFGFTSPYEMK